MREAQISAGGGAEAVGPGEGLCGGHAAGVRALFLASRERWRGCVTAYLKKCPDGHERQLRTVSALLTKTCGRRAESMWRDRGRVVWGMIVSNLRRGE